MNKVHTDAAKNKALSVNMDVVIVNTTLYQPSSPAAMIAGLTVGGISIVPWNSSNYDLNYSIDLGSYGLWQQLMGANSQNKIKYIKL